jgi:Protein of unknown function (DUF3050)
MNSIDFILPGQSLGAAQQIKIASAALHQHPVFSGIRTMEQLRVFMSWHVFAVWDFMSLVKRLQAEFTCISLPWLPPKDPVAARLINDIVMAEESDEDGAGAHGSHFDLYCRAMAQVGADTRPIEGFVRSVAMGVPAVEALLAAGADPAVSRFVCATLHTAQTSPVEEVLGSFVYGRENVIPGMFRRLLSQWQIEPAQATGLMYYLQRHIEIDSDSHGPAAESLVQGHIGLDSDRHARVAAGALQAIYERLALWNALERRVATG